MYFSGLVTVIGPTPRSGMGMGAYSSSAPFTSGLHNQHGERELSYETEQERRNHLYLKLSYSYMVQLTEHVEASDQVVDNKQDAAALGEQIGNSQRDKEDSDDLDPFLIQHVQYVNKLVTLMSRSKGCQRNQCGYFTRK